MKKIFLFLTIALSIRVIASDSAKIVIHFPFNQSALTAQSIYTIDSFIATFDTSKNFITSIAIAGHTDQIGSNTYNQKLSLQRATETANYLKQKISKSNLINVVNGFGKTQLITPEFAEEKRYWNRRVEIIIYHQIKVEHKVAILKPVDTVKPIVNTPPTYTPPRKISEILNDTSIQIGDTVELPYILFIGGLHDFQPLSYPHLDELFFAMRDNPNLEIEIQGHICCASGTGDGVDFSTGRSNLSVARARAVYDFLVKSGIDASRLSYKGFGHRFPLTKERNELEQARNRRVEIKIIKK